MRGVEQASRLFGVYPPRLAEDGRVLMDGPGGSAVARRGSGPGGEGGVWVVWGMVARIVGLLGDSGKDIGLTWQLSNIL